jgi:hypothetical protein
VSQTSYGAMWWTLDRFGIQFTPMTIAALRRARLDEYNTIIMPDGSPGAYSAALGKAGIDTLRGWCERGGTLVTVKGASVFAALKDVNLTSARLVGSADDEESKDAKPAGAEQSGAQATPTPAPSQDATAGGSGTSQAAQAARRTTRAEAEEGQAGSEKQEGAAPVLPVIASPSRAPVACPNPCPAQSSAPPLTAHAAHLRL